jgi:hypothetical protein
MVTPRALSWLASLLSSLGLSGAVVSADEPDVILHEGKAVTADRDLSVRRALSVNCDRLFLVRTVEDVPEIRRRRTTLVDSLTTHLDSTRDLNLKVRPCEWKEL